MAFWYHQIMKSQETARLRNRREERLLDLELKGRRGMKESYKYKVDQLTQEKRMLEKELDRIQHGGHMQPVPARPKNPQRLPPIHALDVTHHSMATEGMLYFHPTDEGQLVHSSLPSVHMPSTSKRGFHSKPPDYKEHNKADGHLSSRQNEILLKAMMYDEFAHDKKSKHESVKQVTYDTNRKKAHPVLHQHQKAIPKLEPLEHKLRNSESNLRQYSHPQPYVKQIHHIDWSSSGKKLTVSLPITKGLKPLQNKPLEKERLEGSSTSQKQYALEITQVPNIDTTVAQQNQSKINQYDNINKTPSSPAVISVMIDKEGGTMVLNDKEINEIPEVSKDVPKQELNVTSTLKLPERRRKRSIGGTITFATDLNVIHGGEPLWSSLNMEETEGSIPMTERQSRPPTSESKGVIPQKEQVNNKNEMLDIYKYNPDGSLRTRHAMPEFSKAWKEAQKARYVRKKGVGATERQLTLQEVFAKK